MVGVARVPCLRRTSSRHQKHPAVCGTSTAGSRGRNFLGGAMVNGARRKVRRLFSTAWPRYALDDAAHRKIGVNKTR